MMKFKKRFYSCLSTFLSLGLIVSGPAAIAADPSYAYGSAGSSLASSIYLCRTPAESPETVRAFAQEALAKAELNLAHISEAAERGDVLYRLGASYACLGLADASQRRFTEALATAAEIEDVAYQGQLLLQIATVMYHRSPNDLAQVDAVLSQAIALVDAVPTVPEGGDLRYPYYVLQGVAYLYAEMGEYEKLRAVLDRVSDPADRTWLFRSVTRYLEDPTSATERELIAELFAADFEAVEQDEFRGDGEASFSPLTTYLIDLNAIRELDPSEDPQGFLNEFLLRQVELIEALPDDLSQAIAYSFLGTALLEEASSARALPFLAKSTTAFSELGYPLSQPTESIAAQSDGFVLMAQFQAGFGLMQAGGVEHGRAFVTQLLNEPVDVNGPVQTEDKIFSLRMALSENDQLSVAEKAYFLGEAEALLDAIALEGETTEARVSLASAYAGIDQADAARRLLQPLLTALADNPQSAIDEVALRDLPRLLVAVGDYEQGVALAKRFSVDSELALLADDLLRAGKDELALAVLDDLTDIDYQVVALSNLVATYYEQDRLEPAIELVARSLQLIQDSDITGADYYGDDSGYSDRTLNYFLDTARVDWSVGVLARFLDPAVSRAVNLEETLTPTQKRDLELARPLIMQIEDSTLRVGLSLNYFWVGTVLDDLGSDKSEIVALQLEDHMLLRLVMAAMSQGRVSQAVTLAEAMRSPYAQTLALTHLADTINQVGPSDLEADFERLQQMQPAASIHREGESR